MNLPTRIALAIIMTMVLYPTLLVVWLIMEIRNILDWTAYGIFKVSEKLWRITDWDYYCQPLHYANQEVASAWREVFTRRG